MHSNVTEIYEMTQLINTKKWKVKRFTYDKKTTQVPVLSHQTTRVKTYHLSAKREGDEFFTEGGVVNENSNEGGFLFIMNLKI